MGMKNTVVSSRQHRLSESRHAAAVHPSTQRCIATDANTTLKMPQCYSTKPSNIS